ncbi:MAG: choice-of-anchor N protein [Planctomycetaceae bacterium]
MSKHVAAALAVAVGAIIVAGAKPAHAVPILQLYIEGSTYDQATESWTKTFNPGDTLVVWAIGNVAGPGGAGTISDVKMAIAYDDMAAGKDLTIGLQGTTTNDLGGFTDPSNPGNVASSSFTEITDGNDPSQLPQLTGGGTLPKHGEYVEGVEWQEFLLGDMTLTDSPIADFINAFPGADFPDAGQINAYIVNVTTALTGPINLHFDLYDSVQAGNKAKAVKAPFSHDAETPPGGTPPPVVPEPGTFVLLALGGAGLAAFRRRRKPSEV